MVTKSRNSFMTVFCARLLNPKIIAFYLLFQAFRSKSRKRHAQFCSVFVPSLPGAFFNSAENPNLFLIGFSLVFLGHLRSLQKFY